MYKKNGFAHPILLFLLVLSLLAGTFIVYKKATTSNFRSMGDPQSQVAGTSTTPIPFILQNSRFKLPATSSDEISKGWVFNKGYFGQASATMVRVKDSSIAKAEAIRIAVTTKPQFRHPSLLQRNVPISPSTEYTLSFVAKASAPIQVQMAIRDMSTTNKALAPIPSFAVNGDWTKYETKITTLAFEPSKRANVGLLFNMPNNSTLILDNIFIRPSSPLIDLDRDDDGVFDDEDECPDTPKGSNPDSSRPGCPLEQMPDRDNDQISDDLDICPDTPKGNIPDPARLGCPLEDEDEDNIDADGDSIPDTADLCPFTHKGDNPDPNRLGCPRVDTSKKTKRWYPGHYLDVNSVGDIRAMSDNQYRNFKGARAKITWSELEGPNKGNYHFDIIEDMMNALPAGKKFFIMVEDRTFRNNCHTEIPAYLRNPQNTFISDKNNCSVKIWEPGAMGHVIDLYKAIGDRFDNDARFMGIMNQETANPQLPTAQHDDLAFQLIRLHTEIAPSFQKSHVFQTMNHLGTGGNSTIPGSGACASLSMVASSIQRVGHGLTNPDTVIWDSLPWDCSSKGTYNYGGLSDKKDKPKPMYYVFRQNTNKMPVATGPDTSQWENPLNGRMFNGERMTFDNMVKYTYLTAVRGYTYNPGNVQVSPFGANFMFWEKSFYSKELSGSPQVTDQWRTAMLNFINTSGNEKTNMQCPANINCTQ